jgi:3-dehydroquinate synthase
MPALDPEELLRLMYHDKKTNSGDLRFVLPSRIGHVELVDNVRDEQVLSALVNPA